MHTLGYILLGFSIAMLVFPRVPQLLNVLRTRRKAQTIVYQTATGTFTELTDADFLILIDHAQDDPNKTAVRVSLQAVVFEDDEKVELLGTAGRFNGQCLTLPALSHLEFERDGIEHSLDIYHAVIAATITRPNAVEVSTRKNLV